MDYVIINIEFKKEGNNYVVYFIDTANKLTIPEEIGSRFYVSIEVEVEYNVDNDGIGSYEYWGNKEYDKGEDYLTFDRNGYPNKWTGKDINEQQKKIINSFVGTDEWNEWWDNWLDDNSAIIFEDMKAI